MGRLTSPQRKLLDEVLARHGLDRPTPEPDGRDLLDVDERRDLTPRQINVLALVAEGYTNARIANELGIAIDTVKIHVKRILFALAATSRAHAVTRAFRSGLIE